MKLSFYKKTIIHREDNKPYMIRRTLFTCPWFSIKLHTLLISDYDCLHDHPWAFISIILRGGYVEYRAKEYGWKTTKERHKPLKTEWVPLDMTSKIYHPGSILFRPANYKHKLEIHQPATTLVITFKKTREWGFITPKGWIPWRNYSSSQRC